MNTNNLDTRRSELETIFSEKFTENGDKAFDSTGNKLLDILFMSEYYTKHLNEVPNIGDSHVAKLFSMFIRDPRFGLGRRDLGRRLMSQTMLTPQRIVMAGRYDDLYLMPAFTMENLRYLFEQVKAGNELAKKWMPRYSSKHHAIARNFAGMLDMNKQQYGHFIKANTVENTMSRKQWEYIDFSHVPSLAAIKYAKAFQKHQPERYAQYIEDVKAGKKELHVATTNVYDIYKNRHSIDADVFYGKIEKINISCLPIIDTSGSMQSNDAIGKALSIGKYLSDCSSYCNGQFVIFSHNPQLIIQRGDTYNDQINNILEDGRDWDMNTNLGAVMRILGNLQNDFPDYLVIMSDMEFDYGSTSSKDRLMAEWTSRGIKTRIVWWNFNARNKTTPETDQYGNVFMSGYSPMMLKYMEVGFDAHTFLQKLLAEYAKNAGIKFED